MARGNFDPKDYGVDATRDAFTDEVAEHFTARYRASLSVDELLLRPREAVQFCDDIRRQQSCYDMPDDLILRSLLARRKNP
jgi:hypothetical protein